MTRHSTSPKFIITNFYDEKEWRYVPPLDQIESNDRVKVNFRWKDQFYNGDIFLSDVFYEENRKLEKKELGLSASDVKYILVSKEKEIDKLATYIKDIAAEYSDIEKNLLVSKIISLEQIKEDF